MTGTETSNAGGGFDLLRRATQAMMSRFVNAMWCCHAPHQAQSVGGGDDDGLAALELSSFSDACSSQSCHWIPCSTTPPADGNPHHLTRKWNRCWHLQLFTQDCIPLLGLVGLYLVDSSPVTALQDDVSPLRWQPEHGFPITAVEPLPWYCWQSLATMENSTL
ncbi:hypothetical protein HZ326_15073 [Fusarium oxysporum f. sp. albedinis]|nr:hypothetical protein HZ326_15073 [Fusarium oxysporum f. sp. albedinis]